MADTLTFQRIYMFSRIRICFVKVFTFRWGYMVRHDFLSTTWKSHISFLFSFWTVHPTFFKRPVFPISFGFGIWNQVAFAQCSVLCTSVIVAIFYCIFILSIVCMDMAGMTIKSLDLTWFSVNKYWLVMIFSSVKRRKISWPNLVCQVASYRSTIRLMVHRVQKRKSLLKTTFVITGNVFFMSWED